MGKTRKKAGKPVPPPTEAEVFVAVIDSAPHNSLLRLVFADWLDDRGRSRDARSLRLGLCMVRVVGGGDGGGGGYGDGGGDGGGYGDGGGGDSGDGGERRWVLSRGYAMTDGLRLICSPGGWSPYVVVAWCRVRDGWIDYAPGHRVVRRFGGHAQLSKLAANGPIQTTQLLDPSETGGGCSVAAVSRFENCDPKAWAEEMPIPKGWEES